MGIMHSALYFLVLPFYSIKEIKDFRFLSIYTCGFLVPGLKNADQRITEDVEKFAFTVSELYSYTFKVNIILAGQVCNVNQNAASHMNLMWNKKLL